LAVSGRAQHADTGFGGVWRHQIGAQYYSDYYAYNETVKNAFAAVDSDLASHQKYTESLDQMLNFYATDPWPSGQ
jgi:hypothetical protein